MKPNGDFKYVISFIYLVVIDEYRLVGIMYDVCIMYENEDTQH